MKKRKHTFLWIIGILVVVIAVAIAAAIGGLLITENIRFTKAAWQDAGDQIFYSVRDFAVRFPENTAPYEYVEFYYCDGTTEYLILQNEGRRICCVRPVTQEEATEPTAPKHIFSSEAPAEAQDPAVYYMDGKIWQINSEGELTQTGLAESPVEQIAKDLIVTLLSDESFTYTHHRTSGGAVPLWIGYRQNYLDCIREKYTDSGEIMACGSSWIQWNIVKDSQHAVFYLHADIQHAQTERIPNVPIWGDVDPAVYQALFS